jgi:hypothetical protein
MSIDTIRNGLINDLRRLGYEYKDLEEIYKSKSLDSGVVLTIIKWLPDLYQGHIGTGDYMVRSLIGASEPFDPSPLIILFEGNGLNRSLKWSIAYVIAIANTNDISDWLLDQLLSKEATFERAGLIWGLRKKGSFVNDTELKSFVELIFDKYPLDSLEIIYESIGTSDDMDFLLEKMHNGDKKLKKDIERSLKKILKKEKKAQSSKR